MLLFRYYVTPVLYIYKLQRYLVSWCDGDSVRIMCIFLVNVSMNCWCLLEPSSAFTVTVWNNLVWGNANFEECFVALCIISVRFSLENCFELHIDDSIYWFNYVIFVESVSTSESMIPRHCFQALHTVSFQFCYMFACSDTYFRLHLLLIIITTTCILLSLRRTSASIHLTNILGVLGTQETFCIVIAGLFERDGFDLFLPKFDKPWVIHLRETCCQSTNLCTWRPNTFYKDRSVRRHQISARTENMERLIITPYCHREVIRIGMFPSLGLGPVVRVVPGLSPKHSNGSPSVQP
jgi:hypothetical protein